MKKPYQIEAQRAVKQFEAMAAEGNPAVQMMLPLGEMLGWLRKGVGELIRQAGLQLMELLMQEEVRELVGERSQQLPERTAQRWGSERGYCVVMGQKVAVRRPRVRSLEDKEVRLGSYELFHRGEPLTETVWEKLMLGLSTRKYGQAVREFTEAYGLEKSAVSEHFIEASRAKLKAMMERKLDKMRLCALLVDATPFEGQQMVVALGISEDGKKTILGIRQGATENATVVGELLGDLLERGLDFTQPRLYILDGGKALTAAVKKHAGELAVIQRCQVHKRRNVLDHLTDEQKPAVAKKLNAAYALEDYAAAKQALHKLHRELMDLNPSAARYLHGGTPRKRRDRMVERFADLSGPRVFLLSLKAGGTGLNLTQASHVFHFDRWWNPAVENQATDRAFRSGQTKNVQVHKFVCAGTLEEKIDEMIERKKDVAGRVVGTGEAWLSELSNAQLRDMFALRKDAVGE